MSGILKRVGLKSIYKGGIYDFGWRRVITGLGEMVEPSPFCAIASPSTSATDQTFGDMISHIDDIDFLPFGDWNLLSGVPGDVAGGVDGFVHGGLGVFYGN